MAESLAIRISEETLAQDGWQYMKNNGLTLCVREDADADVNRTHMHLLVHGKKTNIQKWLQRQYPGNANHSIKKCDDVLGYLRYCCKGKSVDEKPIVLYNSGHDVDYNHSEYWRINEALKQSNTRSGKKRKASNCLEECWHHVKTMVGPSTSYKVIGASVLRWYLDSGRRVPATYAMDTMVKTFIGRQNNDQEFPMTDEELFAHLYPTIAL
jgi:hypothetical protein